MAAVRTALVAFAVLVTIEPARDVSAQTTPVSRCSPGVHEDEALGAIAFPQDQFFCPLVADPKEPRTFVTVLRGTFPSLVNPAGGDTTIGAVGLGDTFGLVRWGGPSVGEGLQLDVAGSVFAQFDLGAASFDLINVDFVIGVPLTFRRGGFSTRARLYHQSSHLGDEYLLRETGIERENLSFESFEVILSQELGPLRLYAGGERVFRREPVLLAGKVFHGGAELRSRRSGAVQLVGAVDVKSTERFDWSPAISARTGIEVVRSGPGRHPGRFVALMLEGYRGPSPYGQFFQEDVASVGVGVHFGL